MSETPAIPYSRQEALRTIVRGVVVGLGVDLQVRIREDETAIRAILAGPDSGLFKRRGGEAIKGLQHVVERILAQDPRFEKVALVEVEGQREEEDTRLRLQATKAAEEARSTGKPVQLPPLNPWQRRVVHLALKDEDGVATYSTGEGRDRRLHVALEEVAEAARAEAGEVDDGAGSDAD